MVKVDDGDGGDYYYYDHNDEVPLSCYQNLINGTILMQHNIDQTPQHSSLCIHPTSTCRSGRRQVDIETDREGIGR
jgi:hypothetical protein